MTVMFLVVELITVLDPGGRLLTFGVKFFWTPLTTFGPAGALVIVFGAGAFGGAVFVTGCVLVGPVGAVLVTGVVLVIGFLTMGAGFGGVAFFTTGAVFFGAVGVFLTTGAVFLNGAFGDTVLGCAFGVTVLGCAFGITVFGLGCSFGATALGGAFGAALGGGAFCLASATLIAPGEAVVARVSDAFDDSSAETAGSELAVAAAATTSAATTQRILRSMSASYPHHTPNDAQSLNPLNDRAAYGRPQAPDADIAIACTRSTARCRQMKTPERLSSPVF